MHCKKNCIKCLSRATKGCPFVIYFTRGDFSLNLSCEIERLLCKGNHASHSSINHWYNDYFVKKYSFFFLFFSVLVHTMLSVFVVIYRNSEIYIANYSNHAKQHHIFSSFKKKIKFYLFFHLYLDKGIWYLLYKTRSADICVYIKQKIDAQIAIVTDEGFLYNEVVISKQSIVFCSQKKEDAL